MSIYLDNAASTPIDKEVKKEMLRGVKLYANPSSFNDLGRRAREELEKARLKIARFLGAHADEIIFTSCGSESNNLAIKGVANLFRDSSHKYELITTPVEHPSVLSSIKALASAGFKVKYLNVDNLGFVDIESLKIKLNKNTIIVSMMYANNEIGTIEPIKAIVKIINNFRNRKSKIHETAYPLFHVDACQATGYLDMNVNHLGVDLLTFNGTKIYGPRGVGILYIRRGVKLDSQISGGDQEFGLRAGTENLPAILGLAKAVELIKKNEVKNILELRDYFINKMKLDLPEAILNGPEGVLRLANNVNISFPNLSSEVILLELDKYGIHAGSGSACTARSVEPSYVLKAIGVEIKYINGAIRFSLGRQTNKKDIDYVVKTLMKIIKELRMRYK